MQRDLSDGALREQLVSRLEKLSAKVGRLESETEKLAAQLEFTERALSACIERERGLRAAQEGLRTELLAKVQGLTTE